MSQSFMLNAPPITLRDWHEDDIALWEHWLKPGHDWKKLDGPYYPLPDTNTIASMSVELRGHIAAQDWPTTRQRAVIAHAQSNTLIGMVSWYWESVETLWPAVGIVIYDPVHWGQGIGYRALGLWCDYLFHQLPDIVRLDLRTWSGNHGMIRLAHKLGFREEARFRNARIVAGTLYDGLGYGVLRDEWKQAYPNGFARSLII